MNITEPTLLLDKAKCTANIKRMVDKALAKDVFLRPHFKTHQSAEIGNWFKEFGVSACTVSSVAMAEYFSNNGFDDITVAFPLNVLEIERINRIAQKVRLNLLVENTEAVHFLLENLEGEVGLFIKIDTGYGRTGIKSENLNEIEAVIKGLRNKDKFIFRGFLAHFGHTYKAENNAQIEAIYTYGIEQLKILKRYFADYVPYIQLSIGDTPGATLVNDWCGIDEIRPGNFVFYDVKQYELGVCKANEIAVAMAAPVVAKHADTGKIIVHSGSVHLSTEFVVNKAGHKSYGMVAKLGANGWTKPIANAYVSAISQEHGTIVGDHDLFIKTKIGDILIIMPIHSCITAHTMRKFTTTQQKVVHTINSI